MRWIELNEIVRDLTYCGPLGTSN